MNDLVHIPFHGTEILAVDVDGKPHVILKPFIEALGLAYQPQHRKLRGKSWATVTTTVTVGADGKSREMTAVDVRTALMLLATIDERRVSEDKRPLLVAYQSEVADVIEAYWTQGGAINPRASEDQLDRLTRQARQQMDVLTLAKGLVDPTWLESKAKLVVARGLGERPEIETDALPLYVDDYLKSQGMKQGEIIANRGTFGRRLKKAYFEARGHVPDKVPGDVGHRIREINAYTERDRPIFDAVWQQYYADVWGTRPQLFEVAR